MNKEIKVEYDGEYPNACSGRLIITVDGKEIYNKQYCCSSSGSIWFDDDWGDHLEPGKLIWNDSKNFDRDIQDVVNEVLSKIPVCCGGCI